MTLFENAYNEVAELVRKFDDHKEQFLEPKYQEAHLRTELYGLTAEEIKIVEGKTDGKD